MCFNGCVYRYKSGEINKYNTIVCESITNVIIKVTILYIF